MKKSTALMKLFITGFISLLLLNVNVGSLRCESPPGDPGNLPPQANRSDTALGKSSDQSWLEGQERENKHERFQELEWLIKQKLLKQYERMETVEYLEDNSD